MKNRLKTSAFFFITTLFLYSCNHKNTTKTHPKLVKIETVQNITDLVQIPYPGKVKPASQVNLAFRIAGPIKSINVSEGESIKKGQILAEIDPRDYKIQLSATEAEYKQVKAEADRVIELYKRGSATPNDYDKAISGLNRITAKLNAHQNALADTKLIAPFDGFVQQKHFDAHETVDAGMPILNLVNNSWLEVIIDIPVNEYINSERFESFYCECDAYPNLKFPLQLLEINKQSNLNQLYKVSLKLEAHQGFKLSPGMSVSVMINMTSSDNETVSIPISAIFEENTQSYVWLYNSDSQTIQKKQVKVKEIHKNGQAVIDNGLKAGDKIISAGVHSLENGEKVEPLKNVSKTNVGGML